MIKKIKIGLILVVFAISIFSNFSITYANSENRDKSLEIEVNERIGYYLEEYNVNEVGELPGDIQNELINEIDNIKLEYDDLMKDSKLKTRDLNGNTKGDIYVNTTVSNFGIKHGHAGIGGPNAGTIIEANPGVGVKEYANREAYWRKNLPGGRYRVRGTTNTHYTKAANYAKARVGLAYGFNAMSDNDFYCSELVYYAWKNGAGIELYWNGVGMIWPSELITNTKVFKVAGW